MSFKAIDLQVLVQRTHDVGRMQQIQQQQGQNQNHHNTVQLRQQFNTQENSVNELDYIYQNNIRDEGRETKKKFSDKHKRKLTGSNKDADEEIKNLQEHLGKFFDLRI